MNRVFYQMHLPCRLYMAFPGRFRPGIPVFGDGFFWPVLSVSIVLPVFWPVVRQDVPLPLSFQPLSVVLLFFWTNDRPVHPVVSNPVRDVRLLFSGCLTCQRVAQPERHAGPFPFQEAVFVRWSCWRFFQVLLWFLSFPIFYCRLP